MQKYYDDKIKSYDEKFNKIINKEDVKMNTRGFIMFYKMQDLV